MKKGDLTVKEVADLLKLPLVKIQRWVHQGKIPCKFKGDSYYFRRKEILEWARSHQIFIPHDREEKVEWVGEADVSLRKAIEEGGIFFNLAGRDIYTVFKNALEEIEFPKKINKEHLLNELLNREEIASTGIGKGAAIPHPRKILELDLSLPMVPVFFLEEPIEFNSVDGQPVFVLFFMFSPSTKIHLKLLSRLGFCLRDRSFVSKLRGLGNRQEFLKMVKQVEMRFISD